MSLLFLAAMQLVPVPPARTPESVTIPRYRAACALADVRGTARKVAFEQTGGRGYRDDRPNRSGFAVQRTDVALRLEKDETGLFAGYEFMGRMLSDDQARWTGVRQFVKGPRTTQIEAFQTRDPARIAIVVEPDWPLGTVAAMGFCDLTTTPQQPLSAAETEKLLTR